MDELQHECGIAAIYHFPDRPPSPLLQNVKPHHVSRLMPRLLLDLQNRGQLAAGFSTYNSRRDELLDTYKEIGTVIEAFKLNHRKKYDNIMEEFDGPAAIGHVRYATSGRMTRKYAQPFARQHGNTRKWFSIAFNCQLANFATLRRELLHKSEYHLVRNNDTEVIMHSIAQEMKGEDAPDLVDLFNRLAERFDGAYNLVFLNAMGEMAVIRDPNGFRPLCYACDNSLFAAASESVALKNLGFHEDQIESIPPG